MNADFKKIIQSVKDKKLAPIYLVDGEEPYYLDIITQYFEDHVLSEAEKDFNLLVLYGKEVTSTEVINTCQRFPMFAERQLVIVKDAAQMKDVKELATYLERPNPTTVLLIEHRFKKVDGKLKLVKLAKDKGVYFTSNKLKEDQIPDWIEQYGVEIGFHIGKQEAQLLAGNLGDDLQKIVNEIEKVRINVPNEKQLTHQLIKQYIGISREYNLFDFPIMISTRQKDKMYRMLSYFVTNAKAAPLPLVIGSFYSHFNTIYQVQYLGGRPKELNSVLRLYGDRLNDALTASKNLHSPKLEMCFSILADYSAKAVGVQSITNDRELLKELVAKLELVIG